MAKQGMKRPEYTHTQPKNQLSPVPQIQGKARSGKEKAYSGHPGSLYRVLVRLGHRKKAESTKKKSKHLGHYDAPTKLGKSGQWMYS